MAPDPLAPEARGRLMRRVGSKDTAPEVNARRAAHALGHRFRFHRRDLPGTPDIVFPRLRRVVMVNGCFWHQHPGCPRARVPASRPEYWGPKLAGNVARDARVLAELEALGWEALTLWECEAGSVEAASARLAPFLDAPLGFTLQEWEAAFGEPSQPRTRAGRARRRGR